MPKVTSDDSHQSNTNKISPKTLSVDEPHGVLGEGLPLIKRLMLLKEKEDREEREKVRKEENQKQLSATNTSDLSNNASNDAKNDSFLEETELMGSTLLQFTRLKMMKAKEDKDKYERTLSQVESSRENSIENKSTEKHGHEKILNDKPTETNPSGNQMKKSPIQLKGIFRKAVLEKSRNGDHIIVSDTCNSAQINDLNKDSSRDSTGNNNEIPLNNKAVFTKSGSTASATEGSEKSRHSEDEGKSKSPVDVKQSNSAQSDESDGGSQKEKLQRSDSFKRAMGEGLIGSKNKELNIKEGETATDNRKEKLRSMSSSSSSSKRASLDCGEAPKSPNVNKSNDGKKDNNIPSHKRKESLSKLSQEESSSPDDNSVQRLQQPDFLKVCTSLTCILYCIFNAEIMNSYFFHLFYK